MQRTKDEERVELHRYHLPQRQLIVKDEVEQTEHNTLAQKVDKRALHKADAADAAYLLQLQPQYFDGSSIEAAYLLIRQPEALYQFYIAQAFCSAARQCGGFVHNVFLYHLYLLAEDIGKPAKQQRTTKIDKHQPAAERKGIHHHKHNTHDGGKQYIDKRVDKLLTVLTHFLQHAQCFAAALVFKIAEGQAQGMAQAICIDARTEFLYHHIHRIVLKGFGNTAYHGRTDKQPEALDDALYKLALAPLVRRLGIRVDDVFTEDIGVEQGKDLVDGSQQQSQRYQPLVAAKILE